MCVASWALPVWNPSCNLQLSNFSLSHSLEFHGNLLNIRLLQLSHECD